MQLGFKMQKDLSSSDARSFLNSLTTCNSHKF